jgi:hypothetical protein
MQSPSNPDSHHPSHLKRQYEPSEPPRRQKTIDEHYQESQRNAERNSENSAYKKNDERRELDVWRTRRQLKAYAQGR